jgi:ribonuclease P protein component
MFCTIKKRKVFLEVSRLGSRFVGKHLLVQVLPSNVSEDMFRVGYVATKKTGNAVKRNKAKRRLRSLVASNIKEFRNRNDYVFIARRSLYNADFIELQKDFTKLLQKTTP